MAEMIFRPTVADDLAAVGEEAPAFRIRAITGRIGDDVVAVGGFAYHEDGGVMAFATLKPDARKRPIALHKAARAAIADAVRRGARRIVATADPSVEAAERWLESLGFVSAENLGLSTTDIGGHKLFIWQAK